MLSSASETAEADTKMAGTAHPRAGSPRNQTGDVRGPRIGHLATLSHDVSTRTSRCSVRHASLARRMVRDMPSAAESESVSSVKRRLTASMSCATAFATCKRRVGRGGTWSGGRGGDVKGNMQAARAAADADGGEQQGGAEVDTNESSQIERRNGVYSRQQL